MYKVLIVDDHESMCDSIERELLNTGDFTVTGRLSNAGYAEIYCEKNIVDLVFMDICTEGGASGLDAIEHLRSRFPELKIIAMSGFDEITYAPRAQKAGAHAFVTKTKSLFFFAETALAVMQNKTYYPEEITISVPMGKAPLTTREMEVLRLMCKNMTNSEIAKELFVSENTIKFHKKNMLHKTGFKNSLDLAFYVISHGWINPLY